MKYVIDNDFVEIHDASGQTDCYHIGTQEAFQVLSNLWLRSGWDTKYVYSFTWLGRPIIQLPEDMFRIQETLYQVQPDVIVETGVAHGGSLIFYASLCHAMGKGRVIGVDIDIRPHNRREIENHKLFSYITLFEGSSTSEAIIQDVKSQIQPNETILVMLDSNHSKAHVLDELRAYADMVSIGSYIVATDGIMEYLVDAPRSQPDWNWNNPKAAAEQFVTECPNFIIEEPTFLFNESAITKRVTYWPSAFLKRIK